ncbi:hypothetical protein DFQ28_004714, partial [Apophysomyces sp. BC1034]
RETWHWGHYCKEFYEDKRCKAEQGTATKRLREDYITHATAIVHERQSPAPSEARMQIDEQSQ